MDKGNCFPTFHQILRIDNLTERLKNRQAYTVTDRQSECMPDHANTNEQAIEHSCSYLKVLLAYLGSSFGSHSPTFSDLKCDQ